MPSDEFEVSREIGGYTLLERLARARAGAVYKAKNKDGKLVAFRIAGDRTDLTGGKAQERLAEVARLLEKVRHPVIPRVLERGKHDERPFVVLELVAGDRLDKVLDEQRLPINTVLEIGRTLARAIAAAHGAGVVHADVCPRSVLLKPGGGTHLLGWGAARATGAPLGKDVPRASIPPPDSELEGNPQATQSLDVFGIGAILYEALAFAPPRPRDLAAPVTLRFALRPSALNPTVPPEVEAVVLKALEPETRMRYASANDLAQDLDALVEGKPTTAKLPGFGRAVSNAVRRRPRLATVGSLSVSLVAGTLGGIGVARGHVSERAQDALKVAASSLEKGDVEAAAFAIDRAQRLGAPERSIKSQLARLSEKKLERTETEKATALSKSIALALEEARSLHARALARSKSLVALGDALRRAAHDARPLDPIDGPEKRALAEARAALESAAEDEARLVARAEVALRGALALAPESVEVKAELSKLALLRAHEADFDRDLENVLRGDAWHEAVVFAEGKLAPAKLTVELETQGALLELSLDGGKTRMPLAANAPSDVAPGTVLVYAAAKGHHEQVVRLRLEPGADVRLKVKLVPDTKTGDAVLVPLHEAHLPQARAPLAGQDTETASTATTRAANPPVLVRPALVDKRAVTRGQYAAWVRTLPAASQGEHMPTDRDGRLLYQLDALDKDPTLSLKPVLGVSLASARAFAKAQGGRLPTRAELWAAHARGAENGPREWADDSPEVAAPLWATTLDLHSSKNESDVVGDERLERAAHGVRDTGFRVARDAPEGS